jgi:hypothetical protein
LARIPGIKSKWKNGCRLNLINNFEMLFCFFCFWTAGGMRSAVELGFQSGRVRSVRRRRIDLPGQHQRRPSRRLPMGIRPPTLALHRLLRRR